MENFRQLKKEFENELTDNILNYWIRKVYDPRRGTFYGLVGPDEKPDPAAPLSAVLITRILWTFSAAHRLFPTAIYQKMADEAFRILTTRFWDNGSGGVYWEVSSGGESSTPANNSTRSRLPFTDWQNISARLATNRRAS